MLNRVATENNILLAWIPGHNDINGIELADIQAKEAAATKTARLVLRESDTKRFQKPTAVSLHKLGYCFTNLCRFCDQTAETPEYIFLDYAGIAIRRSQSENLRISFDRINVSPSSCQSFKVLEIEFRILINTNNASAR